MGEEERGFHPHPNPPPLKGTERFRVLRLTNCLPRQLLWGGGYRQGEGEQTLAATRITACVDDAREKRGGLGSPESSGTWQNAS
jgi:hypothetical protein